MPVTSASVFPYTPGYVHGEQFGWAVQVNRFQDQSEQRYRLSRQEGLRLSYEYTFPSSSLIASVRSWFMDCNGPQQPFQVVDHRTGTTHLARFANNQLDHFRGPHIVNALQVDFVTLGAGTGLQATAFTPTAAGSFCEPVIQTSGTTNTTNSGFDPFSGTIIGSGNSILAYSGADWHFWRQSSSAFFDATYILGNGGGGTGGNTVTVDNGDLYMVPFICTRSGATVGVVGIFVPTAGAAGQFARIGIYTQRSSSTVNIYPHSLVVDVGCFGLSSTGFKSQTTSFEIKDDILYYASYVESSTAAINASAAANTRMSLGGETSQLTQVTGFFINNHNTINAPGPFPDSAALTSDPMPAIYVQFLK